MYIANMLIECLTYCVMGKVVCFDERYGLPNAVYILIKKSFEHKEKNFCCHVPNDTILYSLI